MPFAIYTATESLAPGHTLNVQYTIQFQLTAANEGREILKREQRSLSGAKETLFYGNVKRWAITLAPIPAEMLPYFEEFLDSTADGQAFTFDPYGSELAPVKLMTVDREDSGHTLRRATITGDPQYSDMFEISFELNRRA